MTDPLPPLRPYQAARVPEAVRLARRGRHAALVLATGTGKTLAGLAVCQQLTRDPGAQGTALWLVDSVALVEQTAEKAARYGVPVEVRTIQGVRTGAVLGPGRYDLIVVDEVHKFLTEHRLGLLRAAGTPLLGLTATPSTGDGRNIATLLGEGCVGGPYTIGQAVEEGFLCDAQLLALDLVDVDLGSVACGAHDFKPEALAAALNVPRHNETVVQRWLEVARRPDGTLRPSNLFAVDCAHADALAAEVAAQVGDPSVVRAIHYGVPDAQAAVAAFRAGAFPVACSVLMVAEGFDFPALEVGVHVRPTKSRRLLVQMLGRFLRLKPDGGTATLLDCAGTAGWAGLDLAQVYDVVLPRARTAEPTLTGPSSEAPERGEGIPTLAEVVSRVRAVDLFGERCAAARRLPWVYLGGTAQFVLPVATGLRAHPWAWLVVARDRAVPDRCAAAHLGWDGHRARCTVVARGEHEWAAFTAAEQWAADHLPRRRWGAAEDAKRVAGWYRDREPPSAEQERVLTDLGEDVPAQRGAAQAIIRRAYARGDL